MLIPFGPLGKMYFHLSFMYQKLVFLCSSNKSLLPWTIWHVNQDNHIPKFLLKIVEKISPHQSLQKLEVHMAVNDMVWVLVKAKLSSFLHIYYWFGLAKNSAMKFKARVRCSWLCVTLSKLITCFVLFVVDTDRHELFPFNRPDRSVVQSGT